MFILYIQHRPQALFTHGLHASALGSELPRSFRRSLGSPKIRYIIYYPTTHRFSLRMRALLVRSCLIEAHRSLHASLYNVAFVGSLYLKWMIERNATKDINRRRGGFLLYTITKKLHGWTHEVSLDVSGWCFIQRLIIFCVQTRNRTRIYTMQKLHVIYTSAYGITIYFC